MAFCICITITFQLGFYPIQGITIPLGSLPPIPKLGQTLDGGFVFFQRQLVDHALDHILLGYPGNRDCHRSRKLSQGKPDQEDATREDAGVFGHDESVGIIAKRQIVPQLALEKE